MKLPNNEKELEEFQGKVDAMVNSFAEYKNQVEILSKQVDDAVGIAATRLIAMDNMVTIIKNIHICLSAHTDFFKDAPQVKELLSTLDKFVLSKSAIESGVRANG